MKNTDLAMEVKRPTTQDLLIEWKQRLELNDWTIKLNDNVSPNDMQLQGVSGECAWDEIHKAATINIIDYKDYGDRILPFDKEKTLVHELLHIKFCMIDNSGNELFDKMLHQLIEDMAKALVKAKRSENGTTICKQKEKYNELEYKLECLLCHATGGRYSKAGYSLENMCRMVNEHIDRCIEDSAVERRWEENLQRLKNGLFGEYTLAEEYPKTLLRYWQAQLDAGYPKAKENVRYFEELVRKESENGK